MTNITNSSICTTRVSHPSAWRSSDFSSADQYAFDLGPRHYDAFDKALSGIRQQGLNLDDIEKKHFEVSEIVDDLATIFDQIQMGTGSSWFVASHWIVIQKKNSVSSTGGSVPIWALVFRRVS